MWYRTNIFVIMQPSSNLCGNMSYCDNVLQKLKQITTIFILRMICTKLKSGLTISFNDVK